MTTDRKQQFSRREFLSAAGALTGGGWAAACGGEVASGGSTGSDAAVAGPEVQWRLASSFPRSVDILYEGAETVAERVSALTGGRFRMRVYAPGDLVPGLQVLDAVQQGTVQAGHTASYYYTGKNPALGFDSAMPFGLTARQQNAWLFQGGGLDLLREVLADFDIIQFPCGNTGVQMGGWFRRPIESLQDLSGLRMRIPGIAGEVMTRLGVSVQVLAGGDIFPALERGAIDATEFVGAYDDERLGFHQVADYYYYPGWAEPNVCATLYVNRRAWEQLPTGYQQLLECVTRDVHADILARYDVANPRALDRLVNEHGVTLRRFPEDVMRAGWVASNEILNELAGESESFNRVYASWRAFRDESFRYFRGNELGYEAFAFAQVDDR